MTAKERASKQLVMVEKGDRFAKFLPSYRLGAVDPGYMFIPTDAYNRVTLHLPDFVVDHLLPQLEENHGQEAHREEYDPQGLGWLAGLWNLVRRRAL